MPPGTVAPGNPQDPRRLAMTRLANHDGQITFARTTYRADRTWARTFIDVIIVAGSAQLLSKDGKVIRAHPIRQPGAVG